MAKDELSTAHDSALLCLVAAASMAAEPAAPEPHAPSIKETMAAVGQISHELKLIETRLGRIEHSIASVDASLAPVGALAQPGALRGLILLVTACAAGLIVLHAMLRRWTVRQRND